MGMLVSATLGLEGIKVQFDKAFALGGEVQKFIDSTVLNGVEPYIPYMIGTTTKSGIGHSRIGYGHLEWKTPYVRVIYYGKVMVGPAPQQASNKDITYNTNGHPKAGKLWCERYKADNLQSLTGMVQRKAVQVWNT